MCKWGVRVLSLILEMKFQCVTRPLDQKKIVEGVNFATLV